MAAGIPSYRPITATPTEDFRQRPLRDDLSRAPNTRQPPFYGGQLPMDTQNYGLQQQNIAVTRGCEPRATTQDFQRRQTYATAASFAEGELRDQLLSAANSTGGGRSAKDREIQNIRKWSINPSDSSLREIGPGTILKNIYGFNEVDNPVAEALLTVLALWKYGVEGTASAVINYLEQTTINAMSYDGVQFVEFLRRALDFPRRQMMDPNRPNFQDLLIARVAQACGAKVTLPPEIYLGISTRTPTKAIKPRQVKEYGRPRSRS